MRIKDGMMISIRNLKKRRGRTVLTALGVAIGTSAIVSMLALGLGLQKNAQESFGNFGDLSILDVYPNWATVAPGEQGYISFEQMQSLETIYGIDAVMPVVSYYGMTEMRLGRQYNGARIEGIDFTKAELFGLEVGEGRLADGSIREGMVSYRFPEEFYEQIKIRPVRGEESPDVKDPFMAQPYQESVYTSGRIPVIDKAVVVSQVQYLGMNETKKKEYKILVSGIFQENTMSYGGVMYLPIELVEEMNAWNSGEQLKGRGREEEKGYTNVKVKVSNNDLIPQVVEEIRLQGLETWSPTDMLEELNRVFLIIQLILGGIGSVALLVATIGIVNTMTMAILERNREIGVMKVLGASLANIKLLFLVESGIIGLLGGLVGLVASFGVVAIVNVVGLNMMQGQFQSDLAIIPWWLILFAMGFSLIVGLLAGLYPASKAARISPLEAIRNE